MPVVPRHLHKTLATEGGQVVSQEFEGRGVGSTSTECASINVQCIERASKNMYLGRRLANGTPI